MRSVVVNGSRDDETQRTKFKKAQRICSQQTNSVRSSFGSLFVLVVAMLISLARALLWQTREFGSVRVGSGRFVCAVPLLISFGLTRVGEGLKIVERNRVVIRRILGIVFPIVPASDCIHAVSRKKTDLRWMIRSRISKRFFGEIPPVEQSLVDKDDNSKHYQRQQRATFQLISQSELFDHKRQWAKNHYVISQENCPQQAMGRRRRHRAAILSALNKVVAERAELEQLEEEKEATKS